MYTKYIGLLSALLIIVFIYKKTRDKIILWISSYLAFLIGSGVLFRFLFPGIPFASPTIEYMGFLVIVGIPFLVLVVLIGVEIEKRKSGKTKELRKDFSVIFERSKDNVIFWTVIVLMNLMAFLLENGK